MSLRTAQRQNTLLTGALLLFIGWTALTLWNVATNAGPIAADEWVGQHGVGAVVGAVALLFIVGLAVGVLGELGHEDPTPDEWPPQ